MSTDVAQLLAAELIVAAIIALIVAAVLTRQASCDLWQAKALRDEARALLGARNAPALSTEAAIPQGGTDA